MTPDTFDPFAILENIRAVPKERFANARPFSHAILDGLFPRTELGKIHALLPTLGDDYWDKNNDEGVEVKWRSHWRSEYDIPEPAREYVRFLNSGMFLRELGRLTGIDHLLPDPYYTGGGFNLIKRGGHLDVHLDGNWHDVMQVHRRLNLILYLNPDWREEWGGHLNFYNADGSQKEASILPLANRMVIFETHDFSYHGHPEPLACPEGETRTSIILYYYTVAQRPKNKIAVDEPHSALWRSKGWLDKRGNKTRVAAQ